jgi:superfamily II DNA or RNA helicase
MQELFKLVSRDERQEEARIKWIKNKCKGTWVHPTGAGKTYAAIKAVKSFIQKYPKKKFIVIVPTDNLKTQWEDYIIDNDLTQNGTVIVVNTAIKNQYKTDILVIDECHRVNSTYFRNIFQTIDYKYILGLTATYERLDNLHKEVMEKYCPVIDTISLEEALKNGWVAHYKEYQVLIKVDDIDVYKRYNKQFQEHFEFFNGDFNLAMSLTGKFGRANRLKLCEQRCPNGTIEMKKKLLDAINYHAMGFVRAMQSRKAFINNHPKKIEIAEQIIKARKKNKIITFSNNLKMAKSISIGTVYSGENKKKESAKILSDLQNGKINVINSVFKLNEGADLKGLSVAIILGLDSSEIKAVQRRGRVIRKEGDKEAEIFNIVIQDTIEEAWFVNSHKHSAYTNISEEGLHAVLNGQPPPIYRKNRNFLFRF